MKHFKFRDARRQWRSNGDKIENVPDDLFGRAEETKSWRAALAEVKSSGAPLASVSAPAPSKENKYKHSEFTGKERTLYAATRRRGLRYVRGEDDIYRISPRDQGSVILFESPKLEAALDFVDNYSQAA